MTVKIELLPVEKDKLEAAADILREYSRIYSKIVKGETGNFHDTAASAAHMIDSILKEQK